MGCVFRQAVKRELRSSGNRPPVMTDLCGRFSDGLSLVEQDASAESLGAFERGVEA
jgi:hypothetical protein